MSGLIPASSGKFVILLAGVFIYGGCMAKPVESTGKIPIYDARSGKVDEVERVIKTDAEWKKLLTPEQYDVTRKKGTEKPFSGVCETPKEKGLYRCVDCGADLFGAGTKFESGTGWPSFYDPVSSLNVTTEEDRSFGMERIEVNCARCGARLGHVFDDGPPPTGKRYCINSAAIKFVKGDYKLVKAATFAAGCFWGVEESFRAIKGVVYTRAGYIGGNLKNPTYEDVCTGRTGHAESIEIQYDPSAITYLQLLDEFWKIHDPTTLNRQGPDFGSNYRSVIFYHDKEQEALAQASKEGLEKSGKYKSKIVTQIVPAGVFYRAEEYHQKYLIPKDGLSCQSRKGLVKRGLPPQCP